MRYRLLMRMTFASALFVCAGTVNADSVDEAFAACKEGDCDSARDVLAAEFKRASEAFERGDFATALPILRAFAQGGIEAAQVLVGTMYSNGQGVTKDDVEAAKWFDMAATRGDVQGQFELGRMYDLGRGLPQDYAAAFKWYRLAAEQGLAIAQVRIGLMYFEGEGVARDYDQALHWYRAAAEQGSAEAQVLLGVTYGEGRGVPRDNTAAVKWYRLAARGGNTSAMHNLGAMYGNGEGVPQDYVRAHMWSNLAAAAGGHAESTANRDANARSMTPEQIAEAQRLARECFASNYQHCGEPGEGSRPVSAETGRVRPTPAAVGSPPH